MTETLSHRKSEEEVVGDEEHKDKEVREVWISQVKEESQVNKSLVVSRFAK